jgi:hypothetical protein
VPAVTDARATTSPARAEVVAVAVVAGAVAAVGEGVEAEAEEAAEAAAGAGLAQNGFPRRNSPVAALRRPSALLSSSSRPPGTPRGARVGRSGGSSTWRGVYGEALEFARGMCIGVDEPSPDAPSNAA